MVRSSTAVSRMFLCLIFLQPVFFNQWGDDVFHLAKSTFFIFLLTLLFLVWLVRRFENEGPFAFFKSAFPLPIIAILFSSAISYFLSIHRPTSHSEFVMTLSFFVWFLFLVHFTKEDSNMKDACLYVLSFSVFCASLYGLFQRCGVDFVHWSDASVRFRPSSSQGNPDFFGAFLAVSFPYVLYLLYKLYDENGFPLKTKPGSIFFLLAALWLSFLNLLFTFARASWLAWLVAVIIFFLFLPRKSYAKAWVGVFVMGLVFAITFFAVNRHPIPVESNKQVSVMGRIQGAGFTGSIRIRIVLWDDTLHLIRHAPVFGYGLSTYPLVYPRHRSVDILRIQAITALPEDAHNEFLQRATTTGYFGFFCYLWLVIYVMMKIFSMRKYNPLFSASLLSSFAAYHVQSLFNPRVPDLALLFWATVSFASVSRMQSNKRETMDFFHIQWFSSFSKLTRTVLAFFLCMTVAVAAVPKMMWPFFADMHYHSGELLFQTGQYEKAAYYFDYAMQVDPNCTKCARELALCYKRVGEIIGNKKILLESVKEYEKLLPRLPYDGSLYADCGRAYLVLANKERKYFKQAFSRLKKAISLDPNYPIFYNDIGIAYLNSGEYKIAGQNFFKAKELVPGFFDPYLNLGVLYYRMKNLPLAIKNAKAALNIEPASSEAHASLAIYYLESGRKKDALKEVKMSVKYSPGNTRYISLLEKVSGQKLFLTPMNKQN